MAANDLSGRISEWRLSAAEIQGDLDSGATIVRSRTDSTATVPTAMSTATAGFSLDTVVHGKLVADQQLGSADIQAEAEGSEIKLKGSVGSAELVGRAIALALDTPGVTSVSSSIKVKSPSP